MLCIYGVLHIQLLERDLSGGKLFFTSNNASTLEIVRNSLYRLLQRLITDTPSLLIERRKDMRQRLYLAYRCHALYSPRLAYA